MISAAKITKLRIPVAWVTPGSLFVSTDLDLTITSRLVFRFANDQEATS